MNDKSKITLALLTGPTYTKLEQHRYFWTYFKNILDPIDIEFRLSDVDLISFYVSRSYKNDTNMLGG